MMMSFFKFSNIRQSDLVRKKIVKNKDNEGTLKGGSIILIIVVLFLLAFFFFENYFTNSEGIARYSALGITIAGILVAFLYVKILYKEQAKISNIVGDENKNTSYLVPNAEDSFKEFFKEDFYYLKFKKTAIEIGLIDNNCKWLFKEKELLYFALLINKLKEINYLKNTIENKDLCKVSNKLLDIKIDPSMLSKYDPHKENNTHIKGNHSKYYENVYSVFN